MASILTSASAGRTAGCGALYAGRGCRHFVPFDCHLDKQSNCGDLPSEELLLWRLCCSIATSQRRR